MPVVRRDDREHFGDVERLGEVRVGRDLFGPAPRALGGCHDDDRHREARLAQRPGELPAAHHRHAHIEQHEVGDTPLATASRSSSSRRLIAVGATWIYAIVATTVIVKVIGLTMGLRVQKHKEDLGLDVSQHGEPAYQAR